MLAKYDIIAFIGTADGAEAKSFYEGILGLKLVSDDGFALVFDANGIILRVSIVKDFHPAPFTILGWKVNDIRNTIAELIERGVKFDRFPHFDQDELGIWTAPDQTMVAWFKDPSGNTLSLTQFV
jgi:catechol 2,3-dioxygenase-like lactoylglutathione lyase family enzyme